LGAGRTRGAGVTARFAVCEVGGTAAFGVSSTRRERFVSGVAGFRGLPGPDFGTSPREVPGVEARGRFAVVPLAVWAVLFFARAGTRLRADAAALLDGRFATAFRAAEVGVFFFAGLGVARRLRAFRVRFRVARGVADRLGRLVPARLPLDGDLRRAIASSIRCPEFDTFPVSGLFLSAYRIWR
jgi:hypothetical protein